MMHAGFLNGRVWCLFAVVLFLAVSPGCSARPDTGRAAEQGSRGQSASETDLGIEVVAIRLSANGYMLDFRYRAVDPERADLLFNREIKPYLVHEATNAKFLIPAPAKVGPLRQTTNKPVAGKIYFMMFANPGQYVKAGDQVTIVFGEHRIEHLVVE
jgi:biotin carboxyl carrier protein